MAGARTWQRRIYAWQAAFSVGAAVVLGWAVPFLLQLNGNSQHELTFTLVSLTALGAGTTLGNTLRRMRKYSPMVRAVISGDDSALDGIDIDVVAGFANEPSRSARRWLAFHALAMCLTLTPLRPATLDLTTATAIVLLASLILATASLPMHVLIRHDFLELIERAPTALMKSVIQKLERSSSSRGRINRKIVIAVTTPVLFVALGSALIVNAHLRRDDEKSREQSARALAQSVAELENDREVALEPGLKKAAALGFPTQVSRKRAEHGVVIDRGGVTELSVPLDWGTAKVRFNASTVSIIGVAPVLVSLLATVAAAIVGFLLGNVLSMDLYYATRGVRLLGASAAALKQHTGVLRPPRLRLVAELASAIDRLTARFAVFAQAQEKAIEARATAVRARGLFFASVSHDLKAPLNSILGFTHLVGLQPLTKGQRESLDAIDTRAKELLALIETILDAARVEEGQLSLVTDEVTFQELHEQALAKARQLSSGFNPKVFEEIEENIPPLLVDRVRVMRAVATLIAYSVRTNQGGKMWIRAERESDKSMRIDIDVPRPAHSPTQLEWMLSPSHEHRQREHRGLALGLRLARSVVQLHGGSVRVVDRGKKGAMFCVQLPTVARPMPNASAPLHSVPPPPSSGSRTPPSLPGHIDSFPPPPRLPGEPGLDRASPTTPSSTPGFAPPSSRRTRTPTETSLDLDGIPPPPPLDSHPPPLFPSSRPPSSSQPPMTAPPLPVASHRELLPSETPLPPSSRPFHLPLPRLDNPDQNPTPPSTPERTWSSSEDEQADSKPPNSSDRPTPVR